MPDAVPPVPRSSPVTAELIVEKYLHGVRIDSFLHRHFRNHSKYRLQRVVQAGLVQVDGVPIDISHRVKKNQRVRVRLVEPPDKLLRADPIPLDVIFEDPWIVVVNKQPGLAAHPFGEIRGGTLINALQHHVDRQTPAPGLLRPGIVHRLDRDTSGVVVVVKEHLSHRRLSIQFQKKRVSKAYLALVEGVMQKDEGTIALPIGRQPGPSILMSAKPDAREAKPARTRYEVLARFEEHSLVRAKPLTGRNHQLRVHLAEIGHPVVADEFYGAFGRIKRPPRGVDETETSNPTGRDPWASEADDLMHRQALHAERIAFAHPIMREWTEFVAPLPADMEAAVRRLAHSSAGERHDV